MSEEVAYSGAPGAFGEEACRRFLPARQAVAKASFADVAGAVAAGEIELGMLPRRNSIAGPVPGVAELIERSGLVVRQCHDLPVRMHLMALPGVTLAELARVTSHPVALGQCAETLARLGLAAEPSDNTALAARALAASGDRGLAVVASAAAAAAYGLTILLHDVHDRPDNVTTFNVVAKPR